MIFLCGEGLPVPFTPVSCPLCGMLPLVYESSDRSFSYLWDCLAPSSAPCALDLRPEDEVCDHREQ